MSDAYYHTKDSVDEYIQLADGIDGKKLIAQLKPHISKGARILELGSGPGKDYELLSADYTVTGSDLSAEFLTLLQTKYPDGEFLNLNAATLATDQTFDVVYSNKVLQHVTDDELAQSINRQHQLLSENGVICHSFWKGEGSEEFKGMYVNYQTQQSLRDIINGKFDVILLNEYAEFEAGDSLLLIARKVSA